MQHLMEDSYTAWGELAWAVKTGHNPFEKTHGGQSLWDIFKKVCARRARFRRLLWQLWKYRIPEDGSAT